MVIVSVLTLFSANCPKVLVFFASSFKVGLENASMAIARYWTLFSAICLKVLLFIASSFTVGL